MDWKALYLTSNDRLGQRDFWIAWLILFAAGFVLHFVPLVGMLIGLVLIYPNVCITAKRLHDFGKSGWLAAVPLAIGTVAAVMALIVGGMTVLMTVLMAAFGGRGGVAAAIGGLKILGLLWFLSATAGLTFLLWVGLSKGDPAPNAYGAPQPSVFGGTAPTAA